MVLTSLKTTGSQKVEGPNPSSSTKKTNKASDSSNYLSTTHNSNTQLALLLHRLIEGFLTILQGRKQVSDHH